MKEEWRAEAWQQQSYRVHSRADGPGERAAGCVSGERVDMVGTGTQHVWLAVVVCIGSTSGAQAPIRSLCLRAAPLRRVDALTHLCRRAAASPTTVSIRRPRHHLLRSDRYGWVHCCRGQHQPVETRGVRCDCLMCAWLRRGSRSHRVRIVWSLLARRLHRDRMQRRGHASWVHDRSGHQP